MRRTRTLLGLVLLLAAAYTMGLAEPDPALASCALDPQCAAWCYDYCWALYPPPQDQEFYQCQTECLYPQCCI